MKERLTAALALMQGILDQNQIPPGGQAEVQFKQAMNEVQGALDAPAPAPEPIVKTEVATETMAELVAAKLLAGLKESSEALAAKNQEAFSGLETAVSNIGHQLDGLTFRTTNIESAAATMLNVTQATSDKIDGMEDTLGAFIADHTPATAG